MIDNGLMTTLLVETHPQHQTSCLFLLWPYLPAMFPSRLELFIAHLTLLPYWIPSCSASDLSQKVMFSSGMINVITVSNTCS